ncbi:MAG: flagellar hook-length control protein FliK [Rhodospirillales bacterium]|nr:flagellar hook-length control protein FliK [Rhodospirillales bacterium]
MRTDPVPSTVRVADPGGAHERQSRSADRCGDFAGLIDAEAPARAIMSDAPDRDRDGSETSQAGRRHGVADPQPEGDADRQTEAAKTADHGPRADAPSPGAGLDAAPATVPATAASGPFAVDQPATSPSAPGMISNQGQSPPAPAAAAAEAAGSGAAEAGPATSSLPPAPPPSADEGAGARAAQPPSVQAGDLARVLAAGSRVQVSQTASGYGPDAARLAGDAIVALALAEDAAPPSPGGATVQAPDPTAASAKRAPVGGEASSVEQAGGALIVEAGGIKGGLRKEVDRRFPGQSDSEPGASRSPLAQPTPGETVPAAGGGGGTATTPAAPTEDHGVGGNSIGRTGAPVSPEVATGTDRAEDAPLPAPPPPVPQPPIASASAAPAGAERVAAGDAAPLPPAGQVAIHIAKAVQAGLDRIGIQLSPARLGQVEIRLDITDRHHVSVAVRADSVDALDLLRADARLLEHALQDAGLKTDPGSLSFHLRDHGPRSGPEGGGRYGRASRDHRNIATDTEPVRPATPLPRRAVGGIDIHA